MAIAKLRRAENQTEPVTRQALRLVRQPLLVVGLFSFLINFLILAQPLYMMNLFDRVLTSRNVDTLVALTAITAGLIVSLGFLEAFRSRLMVRVAVRFDEMVGIPIFNALFRANLDQRVGGGTLAQVEQIRGFLTGHTLIAFFDLPFAPLFLIVLFLLHPALGMAGVFCIIAVVLIGMSAEWLCKREMHESSVAARRAARFADNSMRNAEVIAALGMVNNLRRRWLRDHLSAIDRHTNVADRMALITGAMKASAIMAQIIIMATACYLVVLQTVTPGVLFAASVLVARMIAPVQHAVGAWRGFLGAREAFDNLDDLLQSLPEEKERLKLPRPNGELVADRLMAGPPSDRQSIVLKNVSFRLAPGEALGIIGPSGSGKSTLARLLVGVWRPFSGAVRLDGADVHAWDFDDLGPHVGYLPQDIELFDGSIADNICRFGARESEAIIEAARRVGLHNTILEQPEGYETPIRSHGGALSGGQRQRLGLARAVYGRPRLVVLDEPNSNLDLPGERALLKSLETLKGEGATVVVIAHNPRILRNMDKILVLKQGKAVAFGPREEVLPRVMPETKPKLVEQDESDEDATVDEAIALRGGE